MSDVKLDPTVPVQARAWLAAGRRLGFRVEAPYQFLHGETAFHCVAHLPDFGGINGMLVRNRVVESSFMKAATAGDYGFTHVSVESTDDEGFIDLLSDWTWTGGTGAAPPWLREQQTDDEE